MTTAVVIATAPAEDGSSAALLRVGKDTALARLLGQLHHHGVEDLRILTRPEWTAAVTEALPADVPAAVVSVGTLADTLDALAGIAEGGTEPLLLTHGEIITQGGVIAGLLLDPRVPSGIVSVARNPGDAPLLRVRIDRGRVSAAESAFHTVLKPSHAFLGLLKIAGGERATAATVAREIADLCRDSLPPQWEPELAAKVQVWGQQFFRRNMGLSGLADQLERGGNGEKWLPDPTALRTQLDRGFQSTVVHPSTVAAEDAIALVLTGLCRSGVVLTSTYLRELFWARPFSAADAKAAAAEVDAVDEDRVLLDSAVKGSDGFFTTYFVSPYSKYIARWAARRGLTPNQVTVFSMVLGIVAGAAFAVGTRTGLVAGALLLQAAFTFDCVDGQLARYTRQFSKLGAWLDSVFDRSKEYVVFAGLAMGATRTGDDGFVWLLASLALALQTTRHAIDFSWAQSQHQQIAKIVRWPMTDPAERAGAQKLRDETDTGMLPEDDAGPTAPASASGTGPRRSGAALSVLGRAGITASHFFEQRPWMKWVKRIIVLPIGERFALISLTAAIWGPRATFYSLLVWGGFALLYSLTGRTLRSVA